MNDEYEEVKKLTEKMVNAVEFPVESASKALQLVDWQNEGINRLTTDVLILQQRCVNFREEAKKKVESLVAECNLLMKELKGEEYE